MTSSLKSQVLALFLQNIRYLKERVQTNSLELQLCLKGGTAFLE